jgi:hypothetical protein
LSLPPSLLSLPPALFVYPPASPIRIHISLIFVCRTAHAGSSHSKFPTWKCCKQPQLHPNILRLTANKLNRSASHRTLLTARNLSSSKQEEFKQQQKTEQHLKHQSIKIALHNESLANQS